MDVDGENKKTLENNTPQKFDNVKIYAADKWHATQPGKIRNLLIWTRDESSTEGLLFPYLMYLCRILILTSRLKRKKKKMCPFLFLP